MFECLPAVLLTHLCGFLSPKQLLVTLAHTAKSSRNLLTPACFSSHPLVLETFELLVLSSFGPPSSLTLQPFHTRVLPDCSLSVSLRLYGGAGMQEVLDSLDYFPTCRTLSVVAQRGPHGLELKALGDGELHDLLHLPATLCCVELTLDGFSRCKADEVPVMAGKQQEGNRRVARAKRRRGSDSTLFEGAQFSWKDIRLPAVTRLRLLLSGYALYRGGAAFLIAHTALLHLDISTSVVSAAELIAVFRNSSALPQLTHFGLHDHAPGRRKKAFNLTALVNALGTTVVWKSGRQRPIDSLTINIAASNEVFAAVARMRGLTRLQVSRALPGWLEEWTRTQLRLTSFPLLQEYVLHTDRAVPRFGMQAERFVAASRGASLFFQSMAGRPLQRLILHTNEPVIVDAAAVSQLARCQQLRELDLDFCIGVDDKTEWMDWTEAALFVSFTAQSLSCLRIVRLLHVKMSAESVVAIAAASPQLHQFNVSSVELSCHPAVVCAILGGYCEHIEDVHVDDNCCHIWRSVQAADIIGAYQSAVATAARGSEYTPFTRLRHVRAEMCWCTSPAAWHALLSLLRSASRLRYGKSLCSDDPLAVSAMAYLPSLAALSAECLLPASFGAFMELQSKRSGRYLYVACRELSGRKVVRHMSTESDHWPAFELTDDISAVKQSSEESELPPDRRRRRDATHSLLPIPLRPRSDLFTAYKRSLSTPHQTAALARWASGEFSADDPTPLTVQADLEMENEGAAVDHSHNPHILSLHHWQRVRVEEAEVTQEEGMADVKVEGIESDDEEKET